MEWILLLGSVVLIATLLNIASITSSRRTDSKLRQYRPLYVTLTTVPERLRSNHFQLVIQNLLRQAPDKIVLNVPHTYLRTGEKYVIPDWVANTPGITIHRCEDMGPITKLLGGLKTIPDNALVVVVDDDQIYHDFVLRDLRKAYQKQPSGVWCFNVFEEDQWVRRGAHFRFAQDMPCGYSGFIASASDLKQLYDLPMFPTCNNIDDHWLGWAFHQLRMPVRPITRKNGYFYGLKVNPNKKGAHPPWFELRTHTDRINIQRRCGDSVEAYMSQLTTLRRTRSVGSVI